MDDNTYTGFSNTVPLDGAIARVYAERMRQLRLKRAGRFSYTPSDDELGEPQRLAMLVEEVGEVARQVLALEGIVQERPNINKLYDELAQVAAIAVAWLEREWAR